MSQTTTIFPICQRIKSLKLLSRLSELKREKGFRFPGKNLCFVRPHFTLVKERLTTTKSEAPGIGSRPNQHLALKKDEAETCPLKREAFNAHHCSMDSRHQRLAVYAYLWARNQYIQLKSIFFIRTKEHGIAWETIRLIQNPRKKGDASPLLKKYAVQVVSDKSDTPQVQLPVNPDPFVHLTRIINYHS